MGHGRIQQLHTVAQRGDAREGRFYPAFAGILKAVADATGQKHAHVTALQTVLAARHADPAAHNFEKAGDLCALLASRSRSTRNLWLAKRTRFLRGAVGQQLAQEREAPGLLLGFYEDFSKLFAQTITYGLFAVRTCTMPRRTFELQKGQMQGSATRPWSGGFAESEPLAPDWPQMGISAEFSGSRLLAPSLPAPGSWCG